MAGTTTHTHTHTQTSERADLKMNRMLVPLPVPALLKPRPRLPGQTLSKDGGRLPGAPERGPVKITETPSEIDSAEELQIDIM